MSLISVVAGPSGEEAVATLVLLHGLGSNEEDLTSLAPELDPRLRVVGFRAPYAYGEIPNGYAWFNLDWSATGLLIDLDQAKSSLQLLLNEVEALAGTSPRLILGGFSQGAMMSLSLALSRPDLLDGLMIFSGAPVTNDLIGLAEPDLRNLPSLVQHGLHDPVIPVEYGRKVREQLAGCGSPVNYYEYPMGHQVSGQSLYDAKSWLRRYLESSDVNGSPGLRSGKK